ncbi:MAG: CvpA family protein [Lachnospiraceae bacterium]|nr:CvpA family protein [Lachnospiraceae bacterium]
MNMNWFIVNIPFFVLLVFLVIKIILSVRKGAVKEICGVVSMILASILVLLIAFAVRQYFDSQRVIFLVTLILIFLLLIIYKIFDMAFTTMKLISKIPGVHLVNKLLGIPLAIAETVILVWTIYCLIMVLDIGAFEKWIMDCVRSNFVMKFLYRFNYLFFIVANFSKTLGEVNIWDKLGM